MLAINGVQVSLDLSQVVCSQVPYLCVEVMPGASASPAFRLSGDRVECAQINYQGELFFKVKKINYSILFDHLRM